MNDKPIVYLDGDTPTYRASAFGSCLRALWAARSGLDPKPPPEHMQTIFDQGTDLEPRILTLLYENHGFTFADGGSQLTTTLEIANCRIVGHVDQYGCVANPDLPNSDQPHRPIDVKAFAQSTVNDYRTHGILHFPHYAWQQSIYAFSLGHLYFYMPIYNKSTGEIEPWSLDPIPAPYDLESITERLLIIERAYAESTMPECTLSYPCPFYYLHDDEKPEHTPLPMSLSSIVAARIKLDQRIKAFTAAKKTLDEKITKDLPIGSYSDDLHPGFTISHIPNPDRFNTTAAKAVLVDAGVDITDDEFVIKGTGTQLRITAPKPAKQTKREPNDEN